MSKCVYAWLFLLVVGLESRSAHAEETAARVVRYHNYDRAIEITARGVRVVLCPQAGGRVLEFSYGGKNALWFDDKEKNWQPGAKSPMSAGRFDYGPELTVPPHPTIWSGEWTAEIVAPNQVRMTSPRDEIAGVQLIRDFVLRTDPHQMWEQDPKTKLFAMYSMHPRLECRQLIKNIGDKPIEVCHWGRSFSPGGGICLIPLGDRPSRFPSKYAMYEDSAVINVRNTDDKIRERDGFLEILGPPRKPKLGFDSYAGWMAYLTPDGLLFIKKFAAYPDRVYNEAAGLTLSVWYPEGPRIELEPIGPRERLIPGGDDDGKIRVGESATFIETWYAVNFPFPKNGEDVDLKHLQSEFDNVTGVSTIGWMDP